MKTIKKSNIDSKKLEIIEDLVNHCFQNGTERIILAGNWTNDGEMLLKRLFFVRESATIVGSDEESVFNRNRKFKSMYHINETIVQETPFIATNYVIFITSNATLSLALNNIRSLVSWNYQAFFLIVNQNSTDGCGSVRTYLNTVWSFNVLSAVLLCYESNHKYSLYTFNPFASVAPSFWKSVEYHDDFQKDDGWTIFNHALDAGITDHSQCMEIKFDKTKNLHGYTIKAGVTVYEDIKILHDEQKIELDLYHGEKKKITGMLWSHLNATLNVSFYPSMCTYDENHEFCGIMKDVMTSRVDYIMNELYQRDFWKQQSYPHSSSGVCVVASTIPVTSTEKFLLVFTYKFWLTILTASIGSAVLLMYLLKQNIVYASLEFLRMILCPPSMQQPQDQSGRIFFAVLIFLTMAINAYFQSRLSAMYTAPDTDPAIETIEDLEKSNLEVHGSNNFREFFYRSVIYDRFRTNSLSNCTKELEAGEYKSCIYACPLKYLINETHSTHIAKHRMKELFRVFITREDWPLLPRFDQILRRMSESGFFQLYYERRDLFLQKHAPRRKKAQSYKLSLKHIAIAFYALTGGLVLASAAFIAEVFVSIVNAKINIASFCK
ncbi:uncharacterized protein LOC116416658 [Nasonia vitripennis]|uniref:Ionotropic glutamate receptor C-terminal domain-containing protein n=1 Tax=Nasonia vitripennis TaxID=7425 RepID=A0A7M7Q7I8_NASVI|nr:uncharacterized protein LOC116416658 [Nasonia vitripennis]